MSEKETKIEMEEDEREMIDHWSHEHPLTLVETREGDYCYGCEVLFGSREQAYGCSIKECEYPNLLHEECAEMAREIRLPLHHPEDILILRLEPDLYRCSICGKVIWSIGYQCTGSGCRFQMHLRCAQQKDLMDAAAPLDADKQRQRCSSFNHELKMWRQRCSFKCNACGTRRKDSSYVCTKDACQYWIHEKCASLPQNFKREDHHHSLSLCSNVPSEYIRFDYKCDVCGISFLPNYWIYHCPICRYIVHVKCSFDRPPPPRVTENEEGVNLLPVNEVAEELITPFVTRQRGGTTFQPPIINIPNDEDDQLVKVKYKFIHHQHQLTLHSSDHQNQEEEDEENYGVRSELICDGCITPISTSTSKYYYMSCSECKYNLHIACFHLPPRLPSLPLHQHYDDDDDDRHLVLRSCDKLQPWKWQHCNVCRYRMNGLFYACGKCNFKVDIECASLTRTIHHEAHPQHLLEHVAQPDLKREANSWRFTCAASCGYVIDNYDCYRCCNSSCDFMVHVRCAVLPASVTSRRWDEHHPLLLTYDATRNHPGDFYCGQCETQMNPRSWMYHCRACDLSFHPKCFKTVSGLWRHMKLGQKYVNEAAHRHRLTYQLLTKKRRCDICRYDKYECVGFYCASCNFFICLDECGAKMIDAGAMKAVID